MIPASESHEGTSFYCPDCGERLIRKAGKVKIPHFAHRCSGECHGLSEGETPEHLELKQLFFHGEINLNTIGSWRHHCPICRSVPIYYRTNWQWRFNVRQSRGTFGGTNGGISPAGVSRLVAAGKEIMAYGQVFSLAKTILLL